MADERLERILAQLDDGGRTGPETTRLCMDCAHITTMTGAGIMLMSADLSQGSVCSSDPVSALIEDLQYMLGEGPCVDAYRQDQPVVEPDLAHPDIARWFAFTPPAVEAGALAVFGFPLRVGEVRIGALNLYRDRPGPLTDDNYADAIVLAEVAARTVLNMQANAPAGTLGSALDVGSDFHFAVHRAAGVLSVRLDISVAEALVRLRAFAFGHDRSLTEVAKDILDGRLQIP